MTFPLLRPEPDPHSSTTFILDLPTIIPPGPFYFA